MKRIVTVIALVLTVACVAFIFSNSLDSGIESGEKSSAVHKLVNEVAHSVGMSREISHATVRTLAHVAEFAALGALLALNIALLVSVDPAAPLSREHAILLFSLPASILVAIVDELLQLLSPGRATQFLDILIDTVGALCGLLFFLAIFAVVHAILRRKSKANA